MNTIKKRKFFIHVGFPKTASTMLQRQVFPNCKTFRYLGKDKGLGDFHLRPITNFIGRLAYGSEIDQDAAFKSFDEFIKKEEVRRYSNVN